MSKKEEFEEFNGTLSNLADLPNYLEKINQNILNIDRKIANQFSKENNKANPKLNSLRVKYSENKNKKEDLNELQNIVKKSIEGINEMIDGDKLDFKKSINESKKYKNKSFKPSKKHSNNFKSQNKNVSSNQNPKKFEKSITEVILDKNIINKKNKSNITSENDINTIYSKITNNRYNSPSNEEEPKERKLAINKIEAKTTSQDKRNPSKSPNRIYSFKPKSSKRQISISTTDINNENKLTSNPDLNNEIKSQKDNTLKKSQIVENCNIVIENINEKTNNSIEKNSSKNNKIKNKEKPKSSYTKSSSKKYKNGENVYSKEIPKNIKINDIFKMMIFYNEYILSKMNFNQNEKRIMNSYSSFLISKISEYENKKDIMNNSEEDEIFNQEKSAKIIQRKWRNYIVQKFIKEKKNINDELKKMIVYNFIEKEGFKSRKIIGNLNSSLDDFINLNQKDNFIEEIRKIIYGFENNDEKYKFYQKYINDIIIKDNIFQIKKEKIGKNISNVDIDEDSIENN